MTMVITSGFALFFVIFLAFFNNNVDGYGSGNLPESVCDDMIPGRRPQQHGENEVSQKDDLDPPFLVTATKPDDKQFFIGMCPIISIFLHKLEEKKCFLFLNKIIFLKSLREWICYQRPNIWA